MVAELRRAVPQEHQPQQPGLLVEQPIISGFMPVRIVTIPIRGMELPLHSQLLLPVPRREHLSVLVALQQDKPLQIYHGLQVVQQAVQR